MPKHINPAKAVLHSLMPPGSVLKVPDSLWHSYSYASLLAGSALRGCRVRWTPRAVHSRSGSMRPGSLKADFVALGPGWDKLAARTEWGGVLREYIIYLAGTATPVEESDGMPDVKAYPAELTAKASELITNFYADLSAEEREAIIYFLTVGSVNMDYRSQCLDGEAMILLSSWQSLNGMIDFMLLAGMCEWLDTTEQVDALLPPSGGMTRSISGLMKLML